MITLNLRPADEYYRSHYGRTFESVETVNVTGSAAHNRSHAHRVQIYDNRAGFQIHLTPQVIVIAARPEEHSPQAGTVEGGDVVRLGYPDGKAVDCTVLGKLAHDPTLIPID